MGWTADPNGTKVAGMPHSKDPLGFATRSIHIPTTETQVPSVPVAPPLVQSTSFAMPSMHDMDRILDAGESGFLYSRLANPTVQSLEVALADLEGAEAAMAFGSGMAAIHAAATGLLSAGDHVIAPSSVYGGTYALFAQILPRFGIETSFVDNQDLEAWRAAIRPTTKVLWAETLANPTLEVADIPGLADVARAAKAHLVVDSTFTTPYLSQPLTQGADVVVHSASKYMGGHGDLLGGVVLTDAALMNEIRPHAIEVGGGMAPFVAWLVLRGLKTLSLRMDRHCASAMLVANDLTQVESVTRVLYPGLESHADHRRAQECLHHGYGGIVSFEMKGGLQDAIAAMDRLKIFLRAGSLGDAHSLALLPAATSHRKLTPKARAEAGIPDGLIRLSIGLEDPQDLISDLRSALTQ